METATRALAASVALADAWSEKTRRDLRQTRDDLTLVITDAPGDIYDPKGVRAGVDFRVKLLHRELGEIPIDGHRRFVRPPLYIRDPEQPKDETDPPIAHLFPELFKPRRILDPVAALWECLWDAVLDHPAQENWGDPFGTTTTVFSGTADGYVSSTNATYSTARSGSGLSANTSADFRIGQSKPKDYLVEEAFVSFDTSGVPDGDTVSAIVLSLWLTTDSSTTDFVTEAREYDWGASVTTADFIAGASLASSTLMASINSSGIGSTGAYKDFTSEAAFLSATNLKTGTVYLNLSSSRQRGNNAPSGNEFCVWESADTAGTTNDPKLTITHAGATTTNQTLSVTSTATATMTRSVGKIAAVTSTATATMVRSVAKAFAVTSTAAATLTKSVGKILALTSTATATLATSHAVPQLLEATSTATATMVRSVGKTLALTSTATATMIRSVGKVVSATSTATATLTRSVSTILAVTCTATPTIVRQVGKVIAVTCSATPAMARSVGKVVAVTCTATPAMVRSVAKTFAATCTGTAALLKSVAKTFAASSTGTATITRSVGKLLSVQVDAVATVTKVVGKIVSAVVSAIASLVAESSTPPVDDGIPGWVRLRDRLTWLATIRDRGASVTITHRGAGVTVRDHANSVAVRDRTLSDATIRDERA